MSDMVVFAPYTITDAVLTSNVAEDDAAVWDVATAYVVDDQVIYDDRLYTALTNHTGSQPDTSPTDWADEGPINKYKMFDGAIGTETTNADTIEVTIDNGERINAVALFGATGNTAQVIVTDATEGEVYNETKSLQDLTLVDSWYDYFFEDVSFRSDVVFLGLPAYIAEVEVIVDNTGDTARCGACLLGNQRVLGQTEYGTGSSINDYSIKDTDEFGNFTVTERAFSKRAEFDVRVPTNSVGAVQRILANLRATPSVYVGAEGKESTIVYGFTRNFDLVLQSFETSTLALEVEGLV